MSKVLSEDLYNEPEWAEEVALPATDGDLLILTQRLLMVEIPTKVFFQAIAIAAYDCAAAFRYADNYLTSLNNQDTHKNLFAFRSSSDFENN